VLTNTVWNRAAWLMTVILEQIGPIHFFWLAAKKSPTLGPDIGGRHW
jgi:hypothetical protein